MVTKIKESAFPCQLEDLSLDIQSERKLDCLRVIIKHRLGREEILIPLAGTNGFFYIKNVRGERRIIWSSSSMSKDNSSPRL